MNKKLIMMNLMLGSLLVGCAESAYTPNPGMPVNNMGNQMPIYPNTLPNQNLNPMNPMNPVHPQGFNPYLQGQSNLFWNTGMNMNAGLNMNLQGQYYYYNYRGCISRKPYVSYNTRTCVTCTSHSNTNSNSSNSQNSNDQDVNSADVSKLILPIAWKDEDAKALYDRLAREEKVIQDGAFKKDIKARTGEHYSCRVEGNDNKAKNYTCDLEIRMKDGTLLQQSEMGKEAQPVIVESLMYKGDLLTIGVPGQAPEVGYLTIAGPAALYLFQNLPGEATDGKVEEANDVEAKIKTAGSVKCYKTLNTTKKTTECLLKIESNTGKVLNF